MPGISLIASKQPFDSANLENIHKARLVMRHTDDYKVTELVSHATLDIATTGYPDYPITHITTSSGWDIIFEGHQYNLTKDQFDENLHSLANALCAGEKTAEEIIAPWIRNTDGDYIIIIVDKRRQQFWIFNDPLGRLPVYLCHHEHTLFIAREIKFIISLLPEFEYDRLGIAETLLFAYTLGYSTLIKNVHRLDAGTLVTCNLATLNLVFSRMFTFNFDELLDHPHRPLQEEARTMADLFTQACCNIHRTFPDGTHVISLSGGFDSRCVLTGMHQTGARTVAFTFQDTGTASRGKDARYAKECADLFNVPWQLVERPALTTRDIEKLIWIKDGLNYSAVAFLLPIHRMLRESFGPQTIHMTGDNGDRTLDPQGAPVNLRTFDQFCAYTIQRHARFRIQEVSSLVGISPDDFVESIREKLNRYPEQTMNNRYRHFIMAERLTNWNYQAEDRNRTYFWHATPFASFPYFSYAMSVPDCAKSNWKITEEFMRCLDPRILDIPYANWAAPITSLQRYWGPFQRSIYERLPAMTRIVIRDHTFFRGLCISPELTTYLAQQITVLGERGKFFDTSLVAKIVKRCNIAEFNNILTILVYMNLTDKNASPRQASHEYGNTLITKELPVSIQKG